MPRRVFRVCNWSEFPSEVRPGMAIQLRSQIPVVVLTRSKEANEALQRAGKSVKPQKTVSRRVDAIQANGNSCQTEAEKIKDPSSASPGFTCDHWMLEDLMFDFLAVVERNGGVQVIERLAEFNESSTARTEPEKACESNNNIASTEEEGESFAGESENRNDDIPDLSDIENIHGDVEFVDVSSSSFTNPVNSVKEESASPVLNESRAKRNRKPAKRRRTSSSAAPRKGYNVAQAKRSAAIKRIYARIIQRNTNTSSSSSNTESTPVQDPADGGNDPSPAEMETRKRRRFSKTRSSKDDDLESEESEGDNDDFVSCSSSAGSLGFRG